MSADIALIIGNGFSIGFNKFHKMSKYDDTQNPTKWPVMEKGSKNLLIDALPRMKQFFSQWPELDDFDIFKKAVGIYDSTKPGTLYFDRVKGVEKDEVLLTEDFLKDIIPLECRHFLCLAFSAYSLDTKIKMQKAWPWYAWLRAHRSRISTICSYNYDLIIEQALQRMGRSYFNESGVFKFGAIPLYKPHGSCQYESIGISMPVAYPLNSYINDFDSQIKELREDQYLMPRIVPFCVIPNQLNIYSHFGAMTIQEKIFNKKLNSVKYCVIIGHSYSDADKPEIDIALSQLPNGATVIIANPHPPEDLIQKVLSMNLEVACWKSLNGPVNENDELIML